MVMNKSQARSEYREGLDDVGEAAYREASNATTVKEAAQALEDAAPAANIDFSEFERKYANKYD